MKVRKTVFMLMLTGLVLTACNKENSTGKLTELPAGDQSFTGNLSKGEVLDDLSWAWNSSMACFVEPGKSWYTGNHVFYQIDLPAKSTIDIYLTATNASDDIAIYAYSKAAGDKTLPPDISSCVSCEAAPSNSTPITGEKHLYLNAVNNPYSIIIGVAGGSGLTTGEYTVTIDVES